MAPGASIRANAWSNLWTRLIPPAIYARLNSEINPHSLAVMIKGNKSGEDSCGLQDTRVDEKWTLTQKQYARTHYMHFQKSAHMQHRARR